VERSGTPVNIKTNKTPVSPVEATGIIPQSNPPSQTPQFSRSKTQPQQ
jgi:hypothetical protein